MQLIRFENAIGKLAGVLYPAKSKKAPGLLPNASKLVVIPKAGYPLAEYTKKLFPNPCLGLKQAGDSHQLFYLPVALVSHAFFF